MASFSILDKSCKPEKICKDILSSTCSCRFIHRLKFAAYEGIIQNVCVTKNGHNKGKLNIKAIAYQAHKERYYRATYYQSVDNSGGKAYLTPVQPLDS